jgi:hypothetical protein
MPSDQPSCWDDHPRYPVSDWKYEVDSDDTRSGYVDWYKAKEEEEEDEDEEDEA